MTRMKLGLRMLAVGCGLLAAAPATAAAVDPAAETAAPPVAVTPPVEGTTAGAGVQSPLEARRARLAREVREVENSQTLSDTLFDGDVIHGGYGGPILKYSTVAGQSAWFFGGRGGWLINRRLTIGGGGMGMTNRVVAPLPAQDGVGVEDTLMFGYGGLLLEVHGRPTKLINGTIGVLVGGGGVTIWDMQLDGPHGDYGYRGPARNDGVFVFEPEVMVNLNVASFFRVGVGGGYRFVRDVHLNGVENKDFSAAVASLMLKFGKFD